VRRLVEALVAAPSSALLRTVRAVSVGAAYEITTSLTVAMSHFDRVDNVDE
jgi:hypothetical protein